MSKTWEKNNDIRVWVRLKPNEITDKMKEDMSLYQTQSDYFLHILTAYYKLLTKKQQWQKQKN